MRDFTSYDVWMIVSAVRWTIALAAVAFVSGSLGAFVVGLMRASRSAPVRVVAIAWIRFFQGVPLLIIMLLAFFAPPVFLGFDVGPWTAVSLSFACFASANLGEILRGSIEALPKGQIEAARVLGMTRIAILSDIVLPQAMRLSLIPSISFFIQLVKATSLASVVGFVELTKTGQTINNATFNPFTIFGLVALLYFLMCWPLSKLCQHLERKFPLTT
ncbi:amino acid ABC transporter permease [Aureimonas sp. ME7]|uniref:amino acid ABC transporter permease n=1 Tax=Aureimonas sp. ME7 TaxID=2744252 RepID=UPI0015F49243|nr:amino acid ABC transporter permease [Aureimonas sp. ME7]